MRRKVTAYEAINYLGEHTILVSSTIVSAAHMKRCILTVQHNGQQTTVSALGHDNPQALQRAAIKTYNKLNRSA